MPATIEIKRMSLRVKSNLPNTFPRKSESIVDLLFESTEEVKEIINADIVDKALIDYHTESNKRFYSGFYEHKTPIEISDCKYNAKEFMDKLRVNKGELVIAYFLKKILVRWNYFPLNIFEKKSIQKI